MFEILYFAIGAAHNILLSIVFAFRKAGNERAMRAAGYAYFLLGIPAAAALALAAVLGRQANYMIFLAIFIAYLILEYLFDFLLKIPFRRNWKLLLPYLALYFAANYGFFAMAWKYSLVQGMIIGALLAVQLVLNMLSHAPLQGKKGK
ncbi:MAG: hypothetical protein ACYCX2_01895 [Christensenellales bacterium]